jgi:hypothetical protein
MAEITDPALLTQLNAGAAPSNAAPSGLVTDPELLKQLNAGEPEKPSITADIAKSIGSGIASGPVIAAGTPGDLSNMLAKGSKVAGDYIAGKMGFGPSPEIAPPIMPTSEGIKQSIGNENPIGQAINYDPQTSWGKLAKSGAETAANPFSYLGPGGVLAKGATAAASGVGSEAATQATENAKPWVKAVAPLVGAIAGGHVTSLPRVITPNVISNERQAMIDVLQHEGVPLTAGDRTGNLTMKAAESELSPGVNEAQRDAFHQAAFNRVGEHIGDRPIQGANGAVDTMMNRIGGQFDTLTARNHMDADPQLTGDLAGIHHTYNDVPGLYPKETVNSVNGALGRVQKAISQGGSLSGEEYQTLRSNLRAAAQGATDPQRAEGLHGVTNALDDAMERTIQRTNPQDAGAFADARRDYRNALVLQRWAGSANMTPSTLAQSAKAIYGKNQYVRGMDDFSDLAESGRNVMKQFQDSGTARRLQVENILKGLGGVAGFGAGMGHGGAAGAAEGGVAGLLLGELAGPMIARPAARAALMNPASQAILSNQAVPYRFGTSPSTIALMNAIRGGQTPQIPAQSGQK